MIFEDIATLFHWIENLSFEEQCTLFSTFLIIPIVYYYKKIGKLEKRIDILIEAYENGKRIKRKHES